MGKVRNLVCMKCGKIFPPGSVLTCDRCGIDGILDVEYDYDHAIEGLRKLPLRERKEQSIFRYIELLPIEMPISNILRVGWTPLYTFERMNEEVRHRHLYFKDDTVNPSGSLKDRASAIAVAMAITSGNQAVACASTGNAASSLAVLSSSAGLRCYIFVPESIPIAKLYQIATCATRVFRVRKTYEDAFDIAAEAIDRWNWYNRNCAINPYLVEGKKTCSLEIYEQLGYRVPDWIVISMGDGCIISGQYKAFKDLISVGEISRMPKLLGVQADGAAPIVEAFRSSRELKPVDARTIADSIRVGKPRNWRKALRALKESGGDAITVSDDEIIESILLLGQKSGLFAEPAGAAGFAGFLKAKRKGLISDDELVVVIITGSGLKDPSSLGEVLEVVDIDKSIETVEKHLD